jgi:hypothetical protein
MIVSWSETYLRTSLTNAFGAVRSSPANISNYLIEPTPPPIQRPVNVPPTATTQLSSVVNRTDRERQTTAAATPSNSSLQANLPEVCI